MSSKVISTANSKSDIHLLVAPTDALSTDVHFNSKPSSGHRRWKNLNHYHKFKMRITWCEQNEKFFALLESALDIINVQLVSTINYSTSAKRNCSVCRVFHCFFLCRTLNSPENFYQPGTYRNFVDLRSLEGGSLADRMYRWDDGHICPSYSNHSCQYPLDTTEKNDGSWQRWPIGVW